MSYTSQDWNIFFSIGFATEGGIEVNFTEDKARFTKSGIQILFGQRVGKSLYHLKIKTKNANQTTTAATVNTSIPLSLMHLRLDSKIQDLACSSDTEKKRKAGSYGTQNQKMSYLVLTFLFTT